MVALCRGTPHSEVVCYGAAVANYRDTGAAANGGAEGANLVLGDSLCDQK